MVNTVRRGAAAGLPPQEIMASCLLPAVEHGVGAQASGIQRKKAPPAAELTGPAGEPTSRQASLRVVAITRGVGRPGCLTTDERWSWWRETLGSPRYCCAPMVLQSELAFRMLVRRHGSTLCYTPMLPAQAFLSLPTAGEPVAPATGGPATREAYFSTCEADRPLLAQLGGSEPAQMLAAALLVQHRVDGVDINFGCPQACARNGGYGAFLLEQPERARAIVDALVGGLSVPVTAKIRILPKLEETIAFAQMLEDAGVAAVAVHGRRREQRHHEGQADTEAIAAVKAALRIPVISNGNVATQADAEAMLAATGADCVMSAKALLANPRLFGGSACGGTGHAELPSAHERAGMALEYLECCRGYPDGVLPRMISEHLVEILRPDLERPFNAQESKEIRAHRKTTRLAQFVSLVRRVQANGSYERTRAMSARAGKA